MSKSQPGAVDASNLKDGQAVWITSHDLDNYSMLPLAMKRDFGIKSIRHWFLEDDNAKQAYAGLRFSEFLGRKVEGYYCPPTSIIGCGDFMEGDNKLFKGLTIIQLVPDFMMYKTAAKLLGDIYQKDGITARSHYPDEALAQHFAEEHLLNLIGLLMAVPNLPQNPVPDNRLGTDLQRHVRESKLLNKHDEIWKFLQAMGISYGIARTHDNMIGLGRYSPKVLA